MPEFLTYIPLSRDMDNADFANFAVEWLGGIKKSKIMSKNNYLENFGDEALLTAGDEQFLIKKVNNVLSAIGFQHNFPDSDGRNWRTECVLTRSSMGQWLHVRGQCLLMTPEAIHSRPKKPFLLKKLLRDNWAYCDGDHAIQERPHNISTRNIELAKRIICGEENTSLPQIYISRRNNNNLPIDVKKISFELGGMAHVFVEPSRNFSINLMKASEGKNPYAGTIAICIFGKGIIKKFIVDDSNADAESIVTKKITEEIILYHSIISRSHSFDWRSLQEAQSRQLRSEISKKLSEEKSSAETYINQFTSAFDEEIRINNDRIKELEEIIANLQEARKSDSAYESSNRYVHGRILQKMGAEIYDGEIEDRIRIAVSDYVERINCDKPLNREKSVLKLFLENTSSSGKYKSIIEEIKSCGRDSKKMASRFDSFLKGLGFQCHEDGKHYKYIAPESLIGVGNITLPKTPGDHRSGLNAVSHIRENFSLKS